MTTVEVTTHLLSALLPTLMFLSFMLIDKRLADRATRRAKQNTDRSSLLSSAISLRCSLRRSRPGRRGRRDRVALGRRVRSALGMTRLATTGRPRCNVRGRVSAFRNLVRSPVDNLEQAYVSAMTGT